VTPNADGRPIDRVSGGPCGDDLSGVGWDAPGILPRLAFRPGAAPMRTSSSVRWRLVVLAVAFAVSQAATGADAPDKEKPPTATEKLRKSLNDAVTIKIDGKSLTEAVEMLREKTKINFVLDGDAIEKELGWRPDKPPKPVQVDLTDVKVKTALRTILSPYSLGYGLVGDTVLIADEETVVASLLNQKIDVDFNEVELPTALKQLSHEAGVSVILDSQFDGSKAKVGLRKKNVPLIDSIKLIAEQGNLESLRIGNVLFVTDKDTADKIRNDPNYLSRRLLKEAEKKDGDK
jgi:hypothetical protein